MAKLRNPKIFSEVFAIPSEKLEELGVFDPVLNCDTRLFLDPLLMRLSSEEEFSVQGVNLFEAYFRDLADIIEASDEKGDLCWEEAFTRIRIMECP